MRILYHHRTASNDGQAVHIEELISAFRHAGHEVFVVEPGVRTNVSMGRKPAFVDWVQRRLPKAVYEFLELAYNLPIYLRLRRACRLFNPDVLYERHHLYLLAGAWLKRHTGTPYILEVNSPLFEERSINGGLALRSIAQRSEQWVWQQADLLLPVSGVLAGILRSNGVHEDRITVIPNGIDPPRFAGSPTLDEAKRRLGLHGKVVLGFTGFVRTWNALDRVIRYIARPGNENCVLLLVGDGPARSALESLAREVQVSDRVRIAGVVGRDSIRDYIAAFDVALQPAANAYASPLKLFEYLAMGRAIVAPAQANIEELVEDGIEAVLFDPQDPEGLERAIGKLVEDEHLRLTLGSNAARLIIRGGFTWEANARRVADHASILVRARRDGQALALPQ